MTVFTYDLNASLATSTGIDVGTAGSPAFVLGEDTDLEFTIYSTTDHSTAEDVSAATAYEWVLWDADNGSESVSKTLGSGVAETDAANGVITVGLDAGDTSGLSADTNFQHQLSIEDDGSGNRIVVAQGDVAFTEDLT